MAIEGEEEGVLNKLGNYNYIMKIKEINPYFIIINYLNEVFLNIFFKEIII